MDAVNVMAYDYYWEVKIFCDKVIIIYDPPINSQGYSFDLDIQHLTAMGVPRDKIVLGLMPGQKLLGAIEIFYWF